MRLIDYIKDKFITILYSIVSLSVILLVLIGFDTNILIVIFVTFIILLNYLAIFLYNYIKQKKFYDSIRITLDKLDKKYLITEMITEGNSLNGRMFLEYLKDIDKSMHEEINNYKYNINEFKEYIELWCHEIKTPIATSELIIENNSSKITKSIEEEIEKIEAYVEQVLFYARSDTVDKDYIISSVDLNEIVNEVIKKNKKAILSKKIKIDLGTLHKVNSDSKWIIFIINQIISNSIKYSKNKNSYIKAYSKENNNNIVLYIEDNGIGIDSSDINKVFNKGFTGKNGRVNQNSTGMGLYLCKKLCNKLEHEILISSRNNSTIVEIVFPKSNMTKNI